MKIFAVLLLSLWPAIAMAEPPCSGQVSTGTVSLRPKTPLERAYYATAVCYRKKWLDAESAARTSSTALQQERALAPEQSYSNPAESALLLVLFGATAAILGGFVGHFVVR